jgi:hypothetical protein
MAAWAQQQQESAVERAQQHQRVKLCLRLLVNAVMRLHRKSACFALESWSQAGIVCVCVCVYVHTYVCVYIHLVIYVYTHIVIYIYIIVCVCVYRAQSLGLAGWANTL